LIIREYS